MTVGHKLERSSVSIKKPAKVFLSYCHADMSKARKIESDLSPLKIIEIVMDEKLLRYTDDIESYMKTIRACDYTIVLISDAFLKSAACMFEVTEFLKDENYKKRILPVVINDYIDEGKSKLGAKIYNVVDIASYVEHWQSKELELREAFKMLDASNVEHLSKEIARTQAISKTVSEFCHLVRKIKHVVYDNLFLNDYTDFLEKLGYKGKKLSDIRKSRTFFSEALAEITLEKRLAFLNKALLLDPRYIEALNKKGQVLDELLKYDEALVCYSSAINIAPHLAASYISRSYTYIRKGMFAEALGDLDLALKLEPDRKQAYNNRADVHRRLGDYNEAIEDCNHALAIDPDFNLAFATLAEVHSCLGNRTNFYKNTALAVSHGYPLHKYAAIDDVYTKYQNEQDFIRLVLISERDNQRFI
jgi:tetratricopeptide (TPR) repeat protein